MSQIRVVSKYVLAIFMMNAGTMHFVNPAFFLKIMPPLPPQNQFGDEEQSLRSRSKSILDLRASVSNARNPSKSVMSKLAAEIGVKLGRIRCVPRH